jgi:osmoprotectant transport system ATP-binding protein
MTGAIQFESVVVRTPQGRVLLDEISLKIAEGTVVAVVGRSGSGKTTLLRTVNLMVEPSGGRVLVNGRDVREEDVIALRRRIGYVIQETGLFPHFDVERNVGTVLEAEGKPRTERQACCRELLAAVGLEPDTFRRRMPRQLSGGQRQRVGVARALAADPPVLLMDEPFGALDPLTRAEMQEMLRGLLARMKKTVVLVTHDLDEALYLADRIVLMDSGHVVADLTPEEFVRSEQAEVAAYRKAFHRGERRAEFGMGERA